MGWVLFLYRYHYKYGECQVCFSFWLSRFRGAVILPLPKIQPVCFFSDTIGETHSEQAICYNSYTNDCYNHANTAAGWIACSKPSSLGTQDDRGPNMTEYVQKGGIQVAPALYDFVNEKAIPGTGVDVDAFWAGFDAL